MRVCIIEHDSSASLGRRQRGCFAERVPVNLARAGALVRGGWCSEARFHPNLMRHPVFSGSQGAVINIAGSFCVRLVGRVGPKMRIDPGPSNEGALIFRRGTGRKGCGCQLGGSGPRRDGWLLGDRF